MRKFLSLVFTLVLFAGILTGCAGEKPQSTAPAGANNQNEVEAGSTQNKPVEDGYKAYKQARETFDKYALEQSHSHEVVNVGIGIVSAFDLRILDYLLPLDFIGESVNSSGVFDEALANTMLKTAWADDAKLTDNGDGSLLLTGTFRDGSAISIKIQYPPERDGLRLEAQKNGKPALLFEYAKSGSGYAAQYYFKQITSHDLGVAKEEMCVYRTFFEEKNGSCSRFDGVNAEPETLLDGVPSEKDLINEATHWFTIIEGEFTGNLNGKAF